MFHSKREVDKIKEKRDERFDHWVETAAGRY